MSWRRETDPRIAMALSEFHRHMMEAKASGLSGNICIEKLPYWPNGLGNFEAARSVKIDLAKLTKP